MDILYFPDHPDVGKKSWKCFLSTSWIPKIKKSSHIWECNDKIPIKIPKIPKNSSYWTLLSSLINLMKYFLSTPLIPRNKKVIIYEITTTKPLSRHQKTFKSFFFGTFLPIQSSWRYKKNLENHPEYVPLHKDSKKVSYVGVKWQISSQDTQNFQILKFWTFFTYLIILMVSKYPANTSLLLPRSQGFQKGIICGVQRTKQNCPLHPLFWCIVGWERGWDSYSVSYHTLHNYTSYLTLPEYLLTLT